MEQTNFEFYLSSSLFYHWTEVRSSDFRICSIKVYFLNYRFGTADREESAGRNSDEFKNLPLGYSVARIEVSGLKLVSMEPIRGADIPGHNLISEVLSVSVDL